MYEDSALRSVLKAISWRIIATLTTTLLVYLFTGRTDVAIAVGLLEAASKIVLYFFHERVWNRLDIGRRSIDPSADRPAGETTASPTEEYE